MSTLFEPSEQPIHAAVFGASGGIGHALCGKLVDIPNLQKLNAFSRSELTLEHPKLQTRHFDYRNESTIEQGASEIETPLNLIIIATGILHDAEGLSPEKALKETSLERYEKNFLINTIGPALIAKHFVSLLPKDQPSLFAAISARVGSISDNQLGGWHAYRASKAALNMLLKNIAIETARTHKQAAVIGLHPGTVDTSLSKPFQKGVKHTLFTPEQSANYLLDVLKRRTIADSGKCFAWDGAEIPA